MVEINYEKCISCGLCVGDCFFGALKLRDGKVSVNEKRCTNCGHCIAICPTDSVRSIDLDMNEVENYNKEDFDIDDKNLLNFIKFRRSIRDFKDKDIENEKIEKIIEAGRFTPTARNLQNLSYVVIKDSLDEVNKLALESLNDLGKEMLENPNEYEQGLSRYAKMWINEFKKYQENPTEKRFLLFNSKTVILIEANSPVDASLAASNMELMANALGIGVCFSGFLIRAINNSEKLKEKLQLNEDKKVQVVMVLGYPSKKYLRTVPRNKADVKFI